jgi:hypothetical protein
MARFLKHVGKDQLGKRVVVVFRELPDDPEHALVVYSDSLMEMLHDGLMRTVESNAAQSTVDLYEVLQRSTFADGTQMLNGLHQKGLLRKVKVDDIKMVPQPNRDVPLRMVNEQIANGVISDAPAPEAAPEAVDNPVVVDTDPNAGKQPEEGSEEQKKSLAESKLLQARLMEEDAKNLREEAYKLDPDLKKGGRPSKKQVKKVEAAKAEATDGE